MKKKEILKAAKLEIEKLKKAATSKELNRLDEHKLRPNNSLKCIYGMMTGSCYSLRANELSEKTFMKITDRKSNTKYQANGINYYSALELLIFKRSKHKRSQNAMIIRYLKSEIKKLKPLKW